MKKNSALLGAAFLMATSAVGPGFLNNTAAFTQQLGASFGFVILISILLDIAAQLNIWRVITVSEMQAQTLSNKILPGLGYVLSALIVAGGLAFNVGNIAGAGLGIQVLTGLDIRVGAVISVGVGIFIFTVKEAGKAMDTFTKVLGFVMILLILYVVFQSKPSLTQAAYYTFIPEKIDLKAIITLVGGTVGGYISFAGGHRLLEANIKGVSMLKEVDTSATQGILVTAIIRILLFLAAFGVISGGFQVSQANPASSIFQAAAGVAGYKIFGVVLWCASITSVVGAAYTSVSFLRSFHKQLDTNASVITAGFIILSAAIFIWIGQPPSRILVIVGYLNGLILPIALAVMLVAVRSKNVLKNYRHPVILEITGWLVVAVMTWMSLQSIFV
ncbi:divalent metal cation transporter [Cytophagaceae bacterium DM2B3-1]|uniref:Divalent metal cation transporter n=1 Tax=Xanthocytophaga flava TaxID=3048013 RepID=A0ABT7CYU3_9BACT|nr:NRAMP family divalent metal transporter [Xanthocytophaga flavus]MDJ1498836.1 divalent metal cation transporter [Xanthocytophaga flavus]